MRSRNGDLTISLGIPKQDGSATFPLMITCCSIRGTKCLFVPAEPENGLRAVLNVNIDGKTLIMFGAICFSVRGGM